MTGMMNLLDAAYLVVHDYPGGPASLAPRMGKSPTTLAHEVSRQGAAKFGLLDAEKVTDISGDLRILAVFAANVGQMVVPLPDAALVGGDCMMHLADTARDYGELCREVADDLRDGKISDNELRRIDAKAAEMIASVHSMRQSLAALNEQNKPKSSAEKS